MKINRPDLIWKDGYKGPITRERLYPYVLAVATVLLIVLLSIKVVC